MTAPTIALNEFREELHGWLIRNESLTRSKLLFRGVIEQFLIASELVISYREVQSNDRSRFAFCARIRNGREEWFHITEDSENRIEVEPVILQEALKALDFQECEADDDMNCDSCGKSAVRIFFGNCDYWDSREGDFWCGACVTRAHRLNLEDFARAMEQTATFNDK